VTPLVSILIPAYNAESWIADTIRSALAQTWPRKEIIVVDDGSHDQTLSIARQFGAEGVTVVRQKNQGASVARNKALAVSQGDYIQWLDADDLLSRDKIAKQMDAAEQCQNKRTLLSCGWGYFRYRPSKAKFVPTLLWCDLSPVEWVLRKWEGNYHMQTATWLVSRDLIEAAGPWDPRLMGDDDGEYFCRVLLASSGVRFVPGPKVFYRISDSSRWSYIGRSNKKMEAQVLSMQLQIGYLRSIEESERVRAACLNYLQTWFVHFYPERTALVRQLEELAATLGGRLKTPRLSWKYVWIQKLLGWDVAKRSQIHYNQCKSSFLRWWDKGMFQLERNGNYRDRENGARQRSSSKIPDRK
jgi:glycosyltransferase involved in cell wall biosynthesis